MRDDPRDLESRDWPVTCNSSFVPVNPVRLLPSFLLSPILPLMALFDISETALFRDNLLYIPHWPLIDL